MQTYIPNGNIRGIIIHESVMEMSITAGAKLLYGILCSYCWNKDHCWPQINTLARHLSCSLNSVRNYLKELVTVKLIHIQKQAANPTKFFLLQPPDKIESQRIMQLIPDLSGGQSKPVCNRATFENKCANFEHECAKVEMDCSKFCDIRYINNKEEEKYPKEAAPEVTVSNQKPVGGGNFRLNDFEEFYAAYPRKEAKSLALSTWKSLAQKDLIPPNSRLIPILEQFKASDEWNRQNGRFIPRPVNFLKAQRWDDDILKTQVAEINIRQETKELIEKKKLIDEQKRLEREAYKVKLLPIFTAFSAKFNGNFHFPQVFGLWSYLHSEGMAPTAADVPDDNKLDIFQFLNNFKYASANIIQNSKQHNTKTIFQKSQTECENNNNPAYSVKETTISSTKDLMAKTLASIGCYTHLKIGADCNEAVDKRLVA